MAKKKVVLKSDDERVIEILDRIERAIERLERYVEKKKAA
jgi:hypothetical protein